MCSHIAIPEPLTCTKHLLHSYYITIQQTIKSLYSVTENGFQELDLNAMPMYKLIGCSGLVITNVPAFP